ncbi:amino acid permease [Lactobacillus sp. DCY120]|uniref:Amino acid permease n=1 Tax=Bombilactobacillus apium TaxID=2675299 RepID=A0A850RDB1_9LACO|nr:amino acid permease [Bombilactobacillus apium]NVY96748.1 amino acid permease [Bombilactobacillus apium]
MTTKPKQLGIFTILATVVGTVIGGGAFFKIASVTALTGSPGLTLFVWFLAGVITMMAGLTVAELAAAFPQAGGPVLYLEKIFGPRTSFLLGWALIIIYYPANMAALAIVFAQQAQHLGWNFGLSPSILAGIVVLTIILINALGSQVSGKLQQITLIIKLIPIFAIILMTLFAPQKTQSVSFWPLSHASAPNFAVALGQGLLATLFAYDGWISIGNLAGEMKKPAKLLTQAMIGGVGLITIIYLFLNWSFLKLLPFSQIMNNPNTAAMSAEKLFGAGGGKLVTFGILISVYGAINGYCLTGSRLPQTMGAKKQIFAAKFFAYQNPHSFAPTHSLWFEGAIALLMIATGSFDSLTDMLVYIFWIFSILLFIGVFKLRIQQPELLRPYKILFYPWPPVIALLGGIFIVVTTTITQPLLSLTGIGLTLIGLPIYYAQQRWN